MEAGLQPAVGRQPQAVAPAAEMVAEGADEADAPLGARQAVQSGHAAVRRLRQGFRQLLQNPGNRQIGLGAEVAAVVHGHHFNEAHIHREPPGQLRQLGNFPVVEAADEHGVELDFVKAGVQRRLQARQGLFQTAAPGDIGVFLRIQGIQAEIDPPHTGLPQRHGQLRQQQAVGGQADLSDSRHRRCPAADGHNILFNQRLAAGNPQLGDPQGGRRLHGPDQLLLREHLVVPLFAHAVGGHAVAAAEIAQLRDRNAQIGDVPAHWVDHRAPPIHWCFFIIIPFQPAINKGEFVTLDESARNLVC